MHLIIFLIFIYCATAHTVTLLFTNTRYLKMTLAVARDTFRLARLSPHNFTENLRLTIYVSNDVNCALVKPYECIQTEREYESFQSFLQLRLQTLYALLLYPLSGVTGYLMLDSDVVLRRNVADRLDKFGKSSTDVVFQSEAPCATVRCINGGVWWSRVGSKQTQAFVRTTLHYMRKLNLPDQEAFEAALDSTRGLRVNYLPLNKYPNGFVLDANDKLRTDRIHLAHVNWCDFQHKPARLAQIAKSRMHLTTPILAGSNQTFLCDQLRSLDLPNLRSVFSCNNAAACKKRVSDRCLKRIIS